nr:Bm10117 [Brugia malayi]
MEIDATEDKEEKVEEPIARRTRSAKKSQTTIYAKDKSNLLIKTLSLITMMSLIPRQGDIVIELDVEDDSNSTTKFKRRVTNKLLMMEKSPDKKYDPENVKLQYLSDSLRQEFLQQLKETQQRSCQNRNNLLLLIKWLSISNSTLAAKLILQRNDVIAKRINGNLMVAPCKSEQSTIENIEFKGDLISKFEIERINAELEILTQTQKAINSIPHQMKDELFWQEISEEGEEIIKQMGKEFNEIVLPIEEEFENSGWRESESIFHEQLKMLKPHGLTAFGTALGSALRFVNVNRLQTGIDHFGSGRYPFYIEPVVIISITDGNCLTCPQFGAVNEIKVAKPTAIGNELIGEPFRWDQRLYSIVLRLSGTPMGKVSPGMNIPSDSSPIDAMCIATGGRSYSVSSHEMLAICVESIVQKLQQQGIILRFEKYGLTEQTAKQKFKKKKNGELASVGGKSFNSDNWHNVTCIVHLRASRSYPGHWPIPEAFWLDRNMISLPARKAHPVISFRCESSEPVVCQDFPFDKYELESLSLTKFVL